MYQLVRDGKRKEKLMKELEKRFSEGDENAEDRSDAKLTAGLIQKKLSHEVQELLYWERCFMEALRLDPPIPLSTIHETTADCKLINGEYISKGTRFSFNFYAIHRDKSQYHHPEKFMPERYSRKSEFYLTPGN